jgi:chitodextrinase
VGVTGYQVFSGATKVATVTGTSTTVTGLTAGTSYTFTVKAADAAGNVSPASNAVTTSTASPPPPPPPGTLAATFTKTSDWGNGFVAEYAIRNDGSTTVTGWKLEFDLPATETVTSAWSGKLSSSGNHYVLTDEDWTRTIAPGATVTVGFQGAYSGAFTAPAGCRINGQSCAGGPAPPPPPPDTTAPSAPANLAASSPTASTVDLRWSASTDNVGVTAYQVFSGATKVATVTGTSTTVTGLAASTSYTFTVKAVDAAGNVSAASNAVSATTAAASGGGGGSGATAPGFAPYVDMTLNSDSLATTKSASGAKHFSLGFIVSGSACTASWGGYYGLDDPVIAQRISDLKTAGGDAIVSFGGAAGQELARTCTSVSALTAQYQAVIDRYAIRDLDFDIEGADQAEPASLDRRFKAIAQLQAAGQQAGKPVHVSLTLPVMPTGLTYDGMNVMRSAIANNVDVGVVNVMAMDYFDPSLEPYKMGDLAVQAGTSVHDQLATLYPSLTDTKLWAMVGVTPMLGINDDNKEIFTTADATKLTTFAKQKGLGRLAMWSINRDHPCGRPTQFTENTCSGVPDPDWAFSSAFRSFGT